MPTCTLSDPHSVLGVSKSATSEEISKAYRLLSKKYHPDRNPGDKEADAKYMEVQAANDVLSEIANPGKLPYLRTIDEDFNLLSRESLMEYGRALLADQALLLKQHQTPLVEKCLKKINRLIVQVPAIMDDFFPD